MEGVIIDSDMTDGLRGRDEPLYLPANKEGFDGTTLMKTSCCNGNP
jgi:elongation factor P hydroxylase